MEQIDKQVNNFIEKYNLSELTLSKTQNIINSQGFCIIYYNHYNNTEEVDSLLQCLKVKESSLHTKCFLYADEENRFVFVYDDLCAEDEQTLLLHEEGHIFLNHPFKNGFVEDTDVQKESEANYFALAVPKRIENRKKEKKYMKVAGIAAGAAVLIATAVCTVKLLIPPSNAMAGISPITHEAANANHEEYVWTSNGDRICENAAKSAAENTTMYAFTRNEAKKLSDPQS